MMLTTNVKKNCAEKIENKNGKAHKKECLMKKMR
jgi:hypothetical protein